MRPYGWWLIVVSLVLLLVGCAGGSRQIKVPLGQESTLAIGQTAEIIGENLEIRFTEVVEDSRCPRNVTCIWVGRVSCVVEIKDDGSHYKMVLTEPGLTDESSRETYQQYRFTFHVRPYPEAGKKITPAEYRLSLIVDKATGLREGAEVLKRGFGLSWYFRYRCSVRYLSA